MSDFDALHRLGLKLKFAYSIVGLIVGLACILVGLLLGVYGVAGHTSWTASVLGLSTNLSDAAPGVMVFVVGIFMVFLTRFRVKDAIARHVAPVQAPSERVMSALERREDGDTKSEPVIMSASRHRGGGDTTSFTRTIAYEAQHRQVLLDAERRHMKRLLEDQLRQAKPQPEIAPNPCGKDSETVQKSLSRKRNSCSSCRL